MIRPIYAHLLVPALLALVVAPSLHAEIVVGNLFRTTATGAPLDGANQAVAHAFEPALPGGDAQLSSVNVRVENSSTTSRARVKLWSGNGSTPTTLLEDLGEISFSGGGTKSVAIASKTFPSIDAGARYWISLHWVAGDFDWLTTASAGNDGTAFGSISTAAALSGNGGSSWADDNQGNYHQFQVQGFATVVTQDDDSGRFTLRSLLQGIPAATDPTLTFSASLNGETITLNSQITIDKDVTISSTGLGGGITISGDRNKNGQPDADTDSRVFEIKTNTTVALEMLTISGGVANSGGGILNDGSLNLTGITLSGNTAPGLGGGGITNEFEGTVNLNACTVSGNRTGENAAFAGGILNYGTVIVEVSTFSGNSSGGSGGGAIFNYGILEINNSSFFRNTANLSYGGAISNARPGKATISNSTIAGNSAGIGGGGIFNGASLILTNSTISGNMAGQSGGGGIYYNDFYEDSSVSLSSSIVAGNSGPEPEIRGASIIDLGGNLFATGETALEPQLAPLADHGGTTMTMLPLPGSPAIDTGNNNTGLGSDQRGRARQFGTGTDAGATEYQGAADLASVWRLDFDGDHKSFGVEHLLGTAAFTFDAGHGHDLTPPTIAPDGSARVSFGRNPEAVAGSVWILKRSTDLVTYQELFRYDATDGFSGPQATDASISNDDTLINFRDEDPPTPRVMYRLEALLME
ncbi:MAG: hypothetical protein ACI8XO_003344 [Verrucomicrobiales bacterium]|jgi:hypothetical protein